MDSYISANKTFAEHAHATILSEKKAKLEAASSARGKGGVGDNNDNVGGPKNPEDVFLSISDKMYLKPMDSVVEEGVFLNEFFAIREGKFREEILLIPRVREVQCTLRGMREAAHLLFPDPTTGKPAVFKNTVSMKPLSVHMEDLQRLGLNYLSHLWCSADRHRIIMSIETGFYNKLDKKPSRRQESVQKKYLDNFVRDNLKVRVIFIPHPDHTMRVVDMLQKLKADKDTERTKGKGAKSGKHATDSTDDVNEANKDNPLVIHKKMNGAHYMKAFFGMHFVLSAFFYVL